MIQDRKHYACATRSSLPADGFTPKRVVVSRLHDTAARLRTGVKFSPRYKIIVIIYNIYKALIPNGAKALYIIKITTKSLTYKTTLSSYKNIIILYDNIKTNFKKPSLKHRFKRRKGVTRSKFEWKCIPNGRCSNSKRPATISFKIKFRCRK